MGVMEFGIVRNNIYRLSVNKIAGLGSGEPFIDPDQPDEYKAELDINFNVFPWAVRNQDVELEYVLATRTKFIINASIFTLYYQCHRLVLILQLGERRLVRLPFRDLAGNLVYL